MATKFRVLRKKGSRYETVDRNNPDIPLRSLAEPMDQAEDDDGKSKAESTAPSHSHGVPPHESEKWAELLESVRRKREDAHRKIQELQQERRQTDGLTSVSKSPASSGIASPVSRGPCLAQDERSHKGQLAYKDVAHTKTVKERANFFDSSAGSAGSMTSGTLSQSDDVEPSLDKARQGFDSARRSFNGARPSSIDPTRGVLRAHQNSHEHLPEAEHTTASQLKEHKSQILRSTSSHSRFLTQSQLLTARPSEEELQKGGFEEQTGQRLPSLNLEFDTSSTPTENSCSGHHHHARLEEHPQSSFPEGVEAVEDGVLDQTPGSSFARAHQGFVQSGGKKLSAEQVPHDLPRWSTESDNTYHTADTHAPSPIRVANKRSRKFLGDPFASTPIHANSSARLLQDRSKSQDPLTETLARNAAESAGGLDSLPVLGASVGAAAPSSPNSYAHPLITLHTGNIPFSPRHPGRLQLTTASSERIVSDPCTFQKQEKPPPRGHEFDHAIPSPTDRVFHSHNNSPTSAVAKVNSSGKSSLKQPSHSQRDRRPSQAATEISSNSPLSSPVSCSLTSTKVSLDSQKPPSTPRKRYEARDAYGNRPSPRGRLRSGGNEEHEDSIQKTIDLIELARAGPPPHLHSLETSSPKVQANARPSLKKKRSFREVCKDIVTNTPIWSSEARARSRSRSRIRGAAGSPPPPLPTPTSSKVSFSQKLEEKFGSFGRKSKSRVNMSQEFSKMCFSSENGAEAATGSVEASPGITTPPLPPPPSSPKPILPAPTPRSRPAAEDFRIRTSFTEAIFQRFRYANPDTDTAEKSEGYNIDDLPSWLSQANPLCPIELEDPSVPQSKLPLCDSTAVSPSDKKESCVACCCSDDPSGNILERCAECRAVLVCRDKEDCQQLHKGQCPLIQRPHTSFRTHAMYISRALLENGDYIVWQKGQYVHMAAHVRKTQIAFSKQLTDGKGALLKDIRRDLGWSKKKAQQGFAGIRDVYELELVWECVLRRAFMMPKMSPDEDDPSTKHPGHPFHRRKANLDCTSHRGHCANCGVECCVSRAIELELLRPNNHPDEVEAMTTLCREIGRWVRGRDRDIMQQCTDCVAEGNAWKYYCPGCFGVCPLGRDGSGPVCGDVLCAKHTSALDRPCDWHAVDE